MTTIAAWTALVLAIAALALAAALMWQSATTTAELRTHRRAHTEAHGHPDPRLDRRQINLAPPRATGDRRGTRYQPPPERLAPRPLEHDEQPPTTALEQVDLPTVESPAARPRPLPGAQQ